MSGLSQPVRITRDRWGIPHIAAQNTHDLFFAQGFVQAQDRLFQMDLWRRSSQGRLSEVLGANFVERDAMTRRVQYRGDREADWNSYGPDAKAIATAFVRGVNAWVALARANPPEPFLLAGWLPEPWQPDDLLSRMEAFTMTGTAKADVMRARIVAAVGTSMTAALMPLDPPAPTVVPAGLDPSTISYVLGDALKRIGTAPFFVGLAAPVRAARSDGSNNWVVSGARTATGKPILANDPHRDLDHPSLRYLVHLNAPGWNVIGSVVPWFPGVAIGHNERIAWGLTIFNGDVQDVVVEKVNPENPHQVSDGGRWVDTEIVHDAIPVRGAAKPFEYDREYTRRGVIFATDKEKHLAFALRWVGTEPGTAGYLSAVSLDRAKSWEEFRRELARWKMPGENFVYADVDGNIGYQAAQLVPARTSADGTLPVPGWTGAYDWRDWYTLDDLPHAFNPPAGHFATANNNTIPRGDKRPIGYEWGSPARINRIQEALGNRRSLTVEDFEHLQHDVLAWNAVQLVPLLAPLHAADPDVEAARQKLVAWDRQMTASSPVPTLYALWERALLEKIAARHFDASFAKEYVARALEDVDPIVPAVTKPTEAVFGKDPAKARDALLIDALASARGEWITVAGSDGALPWGRLHTALFTHPLAVTALARQRFNVGPFDRPGYDDTVMATYGSNLRQEGGASYREILDVADWDRSVATSAPGQSESPSSPHFADLAKLWAAGTYFQLAYSDAAVQAAAESTLTLVPKK